MDFSQPTVKHISSVHLCLPLFFYRTSRPPSGWRVLMKFWIKKNQYLWM